MTKLTFVGRKSHFLDLKLRHRSLLQETEFLAFRFTGFLMKCKFIKFLEASVNTTCYYLHTGLERKNVNVALTRKVKRIYLTIVKTKSVHRASCQDILKLHKIKRKA